MGGAKRLAEEIELEERRAALEWAVEEGLEDPGLLDDEIERAAVDVPTPTHRGLTEAC